jgi:hypothetical protein
MSLAKQLASVPDQEHHRGWSLQAKDGGFTLQLFTDTVPLVLEATRDEIADTKNRLGEFLSPGIYRVGVWALVTRQGRHLLILFRRNDDMRPGNQFYLELPIMLSSERVAALHCEHFICVNDGDDQSLYRMENGRIAECVEGTDRSEYREAAESHVAKPLTGL